VARRQRADVDPVGAHVGHCRSTAGDWEEAGLVAVPAVGERAREVGARVRREPGSVGLDEGAQVLVIEAMELRDGGHLGLGSVHVERLGDARRRAG
jgi:hypothetical protein